MKQKCNYFLQELKSASSYVAGALCGFVIIIALLFFVVFAVNKIDSEKEAASHITLGFVVPEEDDVFSFLIPIANEMTGIKSFCQIRLCSEEELSKGLKNGDYQMGIVVPSGFYEAANSMQPAEFILYAPKDMTLSEKKMIALLESIERVMLVTEGGIVGMYKAMAGYDFSFSVGQMENDVTQIYVNQYLDRNTYFDERMLSPYGDYSFANYYFASFLIVGVLLCSFNILGIYGRNEKSVERLLFKKCSQKVTLSFIKVSSMAIPAAVIMSVIVLIVNAVCDAIGSGFLFARAASYISIIIVALSIGIYFHLFATIFFNASSSKEILFFLITLAMILLSGGIVSTAFFPSFIENIFNFLPFAGWHRLILDGLFGSMHMSVLLMVLLEDLVMFTIGSVVYKRRLEHSA